MAGNVIRVGFSGWLPMRKSAESIFPSTQTTDVLKALLILTMTAIALITPWAICVMEKSIRTMPITGGML